jgi:ribosomal protein S18 acetylase RimI-like enzyme
MKLRPATSQDFELFRELNAEVQSLHAEAVPNLFKPASEMSLSQADFDKLIANPEMKITIAESEDGKALGYVFTQILNRPENPYRYGSKMLYINHLAVRTEARKQGVGKALMIHAVAEGKASGISRIELDVWSFNEKAVSVFKNFGFETYNLKMILKS